jgi:DNA-binding NtrC family response regulator
MFAARTILVVDDEPDILALASAYLQEAGYRSLSAANADIAFIILKQPAIAFDLLITDIIMPGTLDGVSLAVEARRLLPDLPIIYMTGFGGIAEVRSRDAPPGALLNKPWNRQHFLNAVETALAASPARHDESELQFGGGALS